MGGECGSADELRRMVRVHHRRGADQPELVVARGHQVTPPRPGWVHAARGGYGPAMAEPARQGPA